MKQNRKSVIVLGLIPKMVILGLALLNFVFIWSHRKIEKGDTISFCVSCPWYETWSFTNEPSILLAAAFLLLISRQWSYLVAGVLSGYIAAYGLFYFVRSIINFGLFELWKGIQKHEPNIFLVEEVQWLLAGIIFSFTVFCIVRSHYEKATNLNELN